MTPQIVQNRIVGSTNGPSRMELGIVPRSIICSVMCTVYTKDTYHRMMRPTVSIMARNRSQSVEAMAGCQAWERLAVVGERSGAVAYEVFGAVCGKRTGAVGSWELGVI